MVLYTHDTTYEPRTGEEPESNIITERASGDYVAADGIYIIIRGIPGAPDDIKGVLWNSPEVWEDIYWMYERNLDWLRVNGKDAK